MRIAKLVAALALPLLLAACLLTPGKFTSSLDVHADRSFAFAYKGEVIALDPEGTMNSGDGDDAVKVKPDPAEKETKLRAIAAALARETGYKSVVYQGKGKFLIDYAVSGTLTHNFLFPFNSDAQAVFPFVMVELRQGNIVRVRAPGFASNSDKDPTGMGMGGGGANAAKALDGLFTLTTDAEIISQNSEDGATGAGASKSIAWRATPLTKEAPSATLRLAR